MRTLARIGLPMVICLGFTPVAVAQADLTASTSTASAGVVVPPQLLHVPPAVYPPEARAAGIGGRVELELLVSETGTVTDVLNVRGPAALRTAAIDAARGIRFAPATLDGTPIPVQVPYAFRFAPQADGPPAPAAAPAGEAPPSPPPGAPAAAASFDVVVLTRRPPRSATDFRLRLDFDDLAPAPATSGAALLRQAPGVYISQHSGQGKGHQIFLRGFDAVHGQDVAVHVGGVPVNDVSNIHGQGYVDLHFLIPEVVRTMRVLEGPFDPAQGDFAVAGSIEFDLGLTRPGVWGRFSLGQYGLRRGFVAWRPEGARPETFVAAEIADGDGFGPARAWGRVNAMGQYRGQLGDDVDFELLASSYAGRFDSAGAVRLDDVEAGRIDFFDTYDSRQGGASGRHQVRLALFRDTDEQQSEAAVFAVWRSFRLRSNFTGGIVDPRGDLNEQEHDAVVLGGHARHRTLFLDDRVALTLGLQARHDSIEQSQSRLRAADGVPYAEEADNALEITDIGLYGDVNLRLTSWLQIRGGIRAEALLYRIEERLAVDGAGDRREAFGYHLAPKVTVDAKVADALRLFASYGNGFRSPQAVSLGQGERSPLTVVNAGEVGARSAIADGFEVTAAGFVTHVEEDLLFDHATGQSLFSGPTLRWGGIAQAAVETGFGLHGSASATYTRATKPRTGDQVPFVPPLVAQAELHYDAVLGDVAGSAVELATRLGGVFLAPRPLPFSETSPAIALLDAAVGLSWYGVGLSVEAFNLTDARWRDSEFVYASSFGTTASDVPARHLTAGRPFTLQSTLSIRL